VSLTLSDHGIYRVRERWQTVVPIDDTVQMEVLQCQYQLCDQEASDFVLEAILYRWHVRECANANESSEAFARG